MNKIDYKTIRECKYEKVLDNGLKVVIIPKKGFIKYFASFSTSFGALNKEYISINTNKKAIIPNGVAHFLEHKMFEMSDGTDATAYFSDLGVDSNAFTDYNQTSYIISGTSNLEEAVSYLLDFVQSPYFTKENVEKEKGIIIQEYNMYNDQANEILNKELMKSMYHNMAYNEDVVGNIDDINSITKEILQDVYDTFYHPSNMLFCLVGDVDPDRIIKLIEENQNQKQFKKNNVNEIVEIKEEDEILEVEKTIKMDVVYPKVSIGIKLPYDDYSGNKNLTLEIKFKILLEMLIGSMSDSYQDMLDKEYIGTEYRYSIRIDNHSSYIKISSDSKKPHKFIEYIKNKIAYAKDMLIDEESFNNIKKAFFGSVLMSLNDVEYIGVSYPEYYFKNCEFFEAIEELHNLKSSDLEEIKKYFDLSKLSTLIIDKSNNR